MIKTLPRKTRKKLARAVKRNFSGRYRNNSRTDLGFLTNKAKEIDVEKNRKKFLRDRDGGWFIAITFEGFLMCKLAELW